MVRQFDRRVASQEQTPRDLKRKELETRFLEQVQEYGLDDPEFPAELQNLFSLEEKIKGQKATEQLHHIRPLRQFDGLYANTTPEQQKILQQLLGSGDQIQNILYMPRIAHQGLGNIMDAIHTRMRDAGLEHGGKAGTLNQILQEIDMAGDMPFEYKLHLANQYNKEIKPKINEILDDVLTEYESITTSALEDAQVGTDAMANVLKDRAVQSIMSSPQMRKELDRVRYVESVLNRDKTTDEAAPAMNDRINDLLTEYYLSKDDPKRKAGDIIRQLAGRDMSEFSTGNVSGDKPIIINADKDSNVYLHTNGNGNGHAKMQKKI